MLWGKVMSAIARRYGKELVQRTDCSLAWFCTCPSLPSHSCSSVLLSYFWTRQFYYFLEAFLQLHLFLGGLLPSFRVCWTSSCPGISFLHHLASSFVRRILYFLNSISHCWFALFGEAYKLVAFSGRVHGWSIYWDFTCPPESSFKSHSWFIIWGYVIQVVSNSPSGFWSLGLNWFYSC